MAFVPGHSGGNWPRSALLAQEKHCLGVADLLPCPGERQLWRCFLPRNCTAVFLQISAMTNGSSANVFEIIVAFLVLCAL